MGLSEIAAPLSGRHALVTGAGRGIGRGCALGLGAAGARVTVLARSEAELGSLADEIRDQGGVADVTVADATDPAAVASAVVAAHGRAPLSILVTCAGTNRPGPTLDLAVADFDDVMAVNVRGTFLACQAFGRLLLTEGRPGRVVTMSSQMGVVGYPGRAAYCASKHAVNGLTKALAVEWAPNAITVNAVAPTFVLTPLTEPMLADAAFVRDVHQRIPAGRIAAISDVVAAVLYLVSDAAGMVTGHVLAVDGGWTAW